MKLSIFLFFTVIAGCSSLPSKITQLKAGMPREDVDQIMGTPDSKSANGFSETLYYTGTTSFGVQDTFFVTLSGDRVNTFGQLQRQPMDPATAALLMNSMQQNRPQPVQPYQMPIRKTTNCISNRVGNQTYTNCQ